MREIVRYSKGKRFVCKPVASGVWYIFWSENRRSKRQSTGAKNETEADAFLDEWLKIEEGEGPALTCRELYDLKYPDEGPGHSLHSQGKALKAFFGDMTPAEVTQAVEDRYKRSRKVSSATLRVELSRLRASWNYGVKKKLLGPGDVPVLDPLPEAAPPRDRWLRREEYWRLLRAARGDLRIRAFLHVALRTGARRTAIQELTWDQVDFETGVIHFLQAGRNQTSKRRASVPISRSLMRVLKVLHRHRKDAYVIGAGATVNKVLSRVAKDAEVEGVSPHVLRHTLATWLAREGVSLWKIAKVLGNSVEQVEKVYAKHSPEMLVDAVNAI